MDGSTVGGTEFPNGSDNDSRYYQIGTTLYMNKKEICGLNCIEFSPSATTHGGYLDFHFNNSTADYTSRIIEETSGRLKFDTPAGLQTNGGIYVSAYGSRPGQFIAAAGDYSFMIRNDGNATYFLLTNKGDPTGSWNNLRPIQIANATGNVVSGTTIYAPTFQISSDRRLKSNLVELTDCLERIEKLTGYSYNLNSCDRRRAGLIAQDVEAVLPEAVSENPDGFKTVDYSDVTAMIINAIKQLSAEVADLKSQLQTVANQNKLSV